jgi:acyl-CoA synthetase (AMP-forming)/AMP-acid ligase II
MKIEAGFLSRMAAERFAERIALTWNGTHETFREMNETANRFGSGLLATGLERGDRIAVLSYNRPEVVHAWLGCEKFAFVRVAMHTHNPVEDHVAVLRHVGARALVFDTAFTGLVEPVRGQLPDGTVFIAIGPGCPPWARPFGDLVAAGSPADPLLDVDEDDVCFLQLTSGTTGMSKPWVKTYRSWRAVVEHNAVHLDTFDGQPAVGPDDVNLHFHPLQWATGFQTLYPYLNRGARTVIVSDEQFDPAAVVDLMAAEGVTGTFAPGPLLAPILDVVEARGGAAAAGLVLKRVVVFFGSPELLTRFSRLAGPVWAHAFGSTEQGAATTRLLPSDVAAEPGRLNSVGRSASPDLEVAITDPSGARVPIEEVGEILVRSAMSAGWYWDMPDRNEACFYPGGWFRSGDVGYLDADGFLFYGDRASDTIQVDGQVIYPHTVEAALLAHDSVANCGVVAVARGDGAVVTAAVVLKAGRADCTDDLRGLVREAVGAVEREPEIVLVAELPTVLGGAKVQRGALRERLEALR